MGCGNRRRKIFLTYYAVINRISGISTKHSDNGEIVVKPCNIAAGKTVILALYGGDKGNKLVEIQSREYTGTGSHIHTDQTLYTCKGYGLEQP